MMFKLPMRMVTLLLELLLTVLHELEMAFRKSFAWHHPVVLHRINSLGPDAH